MRIGFVDHHLNNFHANKFLSLLREHFASEGVQVAAAWESDPAGEDWCEKNGVPRRDSAEEVAAECDTVMVLAPNDPDAHLALCRRVLPAQKPTLVDKILAPNRQDARAILDLAAQEGVQIFSASALRFAVELEPVLPGDRVEEAFARGMGDWANYGMHTLSLLLAGLGAEVDRLIDTGAGQTASVTLGYSDGRRGYVEVRSAANEWETLPWTFGCRSDQKYRVGVVKDFNGFYLNLMRRVVHFFRTGESPISPEEMLMVPTILDAAARSRQSGGTWIDLRGE